MSARHKTLLTELVALLTALMPRPAAAQASGESRLQWLPEWRRVGAPEYAVTTSLFATRALMTFAIPAADEPGWVRPVLFDTPLRNALYLEDRSSRDHAGAISDTLATASIIHPVIIDTMFVTAVSDQNADVAWQMFVISMQSYSITLLANSVAKRLFSRQRPYAIACAEDPEYSDLCDHQDRFKSYYSGHAAFTATSAGLVCAHHTHLPLYGGRWIDTAACGASIVGTLATGALRIAADKHWATDVFTGHLLGFASGYVLPSLLYYKGFSARPDEAEAAAASAPLAAPMAPQVSFGGTF